jgi:hypothetical protein
VQAKLEGAKQADDWLISSEAVTVQHREPAA